MQASVVFNRTVDEKSSLFVKNSTGNFSHAPKYGKNAISKHAMVKSLLEKNIENFSFSTSTALKCFKRTCLVCGVC